MANSRPVALAMVFSLAGCALLNPPVSGALIAPSGGALTLAKGATFSIELKGSSSGFWNQAPSNSTNGIATPSAIDPYGGNESYPNGSNGPVVFDYRAIAPGTADLTFDHDASIVGGTSTTATVRVTVD